MLRSLHILLVDLKALERGRTVPNWCFLEKYICVNSKDDFGGRGKSEDSDYPEGYYNTLKKIREPRAPPLEVELRKWI